MRFNWKAAFAISLAWLVLQYSLVASQQSSTLIIANSGAPAGGCSNGVIYVDHTAGVLWLCSSGGWINPLAASAVPSGFVGMVSAGSCPAGYSELTALDGSMPIGTLAAHGNIGSTGGADSVTPTVATLTAAAQAFTGSSATTSSNSAGTPAGTVTAPTVSWPVGVPTSSSISLSGSTATESAHTHSVTAAGTNGTVTGPAQVISWPAGVPTFTGSALGTHSHGAGTLADATSGSIIKLFTASASGVAAATLSGSTAAVSAGTPAGTVAWPAGVPTNATSTIPAEIFTGSAVTSGAGSAHSHGVGTLAASTPTIAWPAGVPTNSTPTFSGSALSGHTHTLTATGTNATSSVTGTLNSFDNRSAFVRVIFCQKT